MTGPTADAKLAQKILDERRLATAGLPRHTEHGPSALDCRIERGAQGAALLLVPDRVSSPGGDCLLAQVFDRHALGGGGLESEAPDQLAHTGFGSRAELLANESLVGAAVL